MKLKRGSWRTTKEKKLLPQTSTNSNSCGSSKRVQESGKFKILAFYTELGKSNTVFTSILNFVSLKGNARERERKYTNIFTVIGILLSVKISQDAKLFFNCVMYMQWFESLQKLFSMPFPTPWKRQDQTLPRLDISPTDTSPNWHFPERLFPRLDISPTGHSPD